MLGLFKKTFKGLEKTRKKVSNVFSSISQKSYLEECDFEMLEDCLYQADISYGIVEKVIDGLRDKDSSTKDWKDRAKDLLLDKIKINHNLDDIKKVVILVGINGSGKTTSAAKLAQYYVHKKESVCMVAGDTYRAAAIDQIKIWAERLKVHVVSNDKSSDPASIAYDGISSGLSKSADRIIIDTSGRMNTSLNLMKELEKIYKVSSKLSEDIDILITIDANSGQNAFQQVKDFKNYLPLTGIIMTKMDGTAKGGIVLQIIKKLNLPIYFMGVGEKIDDLIPFDEDDYICSLFKDKEKINNE